MDFVFRRVPPPCQIIGKMYISPEAGPGWRARASYLRPAASAPETLFCYTETKEKPERCGRAGNLPGFGKYGLGPARQTDEGGKYGDVWRESNKAGELEIKTVLG